MKTISTDLPLRYRLDIKIVKRRGHLRGEDTLLPSIKKIAGTKSGNKVSRYFRHVFEHKHIKRILGTNIAVLVMASSFTPSLTSRIDVSAQEITVSGDSVKLKTEGHIQYPLKRIQINQSYSFFHPGIDFEGVTGDPVFSVMAGEVEAVQYSNFAYGNAVLVRHGENYLSLYAHLSKIYVKKGDSVNLNTILGEVGSTGRSTGDHLHLEIRENGRNINPFSMLPQR